MFPVLLYDVLHAFLSFFYDNRVLHVIHKLRNKRLQNLVFGKLSCCFTARVFPSEDKRVTINYRGKAIRSPKSGVLGESHERIGRATVK